MSGKADKKSRQRQKKKEEVTLKAGRDAMEDPVKLKAAVKTR